MLSVLAVLIADARFSRSSCTYIHTHGMLSILPIHGLPPSLPIYLVSYRSHSHFKCFLHSLPQRKPPVPAIRAKKQGIYTVLKENMGETLTSPRATLASLHTHTHGGRHLCHCDKGFPFHTSHPIPSHPHPIPSHLISLTHLPISSPNLLPPSSHQFKTFHPLQQNTSFSSQLLHLPHPPANHKEKHSRFSQVRWIGLDWIGLDWIRLEWENSSLGGFFRGLVFCRLCF